MMRHKGMVKIRGRWLTPEEAERAEQGEEVKPEADRPAPPERREGIFSRKLEYEECPKCSGTGVEIWLPCNQCARSPRSGYLYMGDHMQPCGRCRTKGKLPGLQCRLCRGHGKVRSDKLEEREYAEPKIPKGCEICFKCNGTGAELWLPCNQCARSGYPGLLYFGDYLQVCNRCGGRGKLPGIQCTECRGNGLVRAEGAGGEEEEDEDEDDDWDF
jgi:DnaJ-class molecular chaperone